jgi:hypothetical protein
MSDRYEQDRDRQWRGGRNYEAGRDEQDREYQNSGNDDREWRSGNRGDMQQNWSGQGDAYRMNDEREWRGGRGGGGQMGSGERMHRGYRGGGGHFYNFNRGEFDRQNYNAMGGPAENGRWDDQNEWSSHRSSWSGAEGPGQGRDSGRYAAGGSYYGGTSDFGGGLGQYGEQGRHSGRGPKGYKRSDERIQEDVNERLTHDAWVDASEIEVQVKDGEVTLTGTVNSRDEKRRAEDAVERVSGVREVHNQIRVQHQNQGAMATQSHSAGNQSSQQSGQSSQQSGQSAQTNAQTSAKTNSGQQTTARNT